MGATLYRELDERPLHIVRGEGCYLTDQFGKSYLDLAGGACYASLGHSNERVLGAIREETLKSPAVFGGFFATQAAEEAGELLASLFEAVKPGWFGKVIFQQGGGEAVDLACRLAVQYHAEVGNTRNKFAAANTAFHGVGYLSSALSEYYPRYGLVEKALDHRGSVYRGLKLDGHDVAAFVIEPVTGPQRGCFAYQTAALSIARQVCDETDTVLIYDEVLCGSGRCGYLSLAEMHGVWPDIIVLGKSLTSGYQPMSAICVSQKLIDRIAKGSRTVMFGTTYSAHSVGCRAVQASLQYMIDNQLFQRVRDKGKEFARYTRRKLAKFPIVDQVNPSGFLIGISLGLNNHPLNPSLAMHKRVRNSIRDAGVIVYSKGQTNDGVGDYIVLAPPYEISDEDFLAGLDVIARAVEKVGDSR